MLVVQKCETKSSSNLHLLQHQRIEIMPTKASVHFSSGCSAGWSQTEEARLLTTASVSGCSALASKAARRCYQDSVRWPPRLPPPACAGSRCTTSTCKLVLLSSNASGICIAKRCTSRCGSRQAFCRPCMKHGSVDQCSMHGDARHLRLCSARCCETGLCIYASLCVTTMMHGMCQTPARLLDCRDGWRCRRNPAEHFSSDC